MGWGQLYYSLCRTRLGHYLARSVVAGSRSLGAFHSFCTPLDALELNHEAAAGLMELWSHMHWSSGDGMMPSEQLLAVYRLAATWPGRGDIVELGSWTGLTTCYLATACRVRGEGTVYAVDTFEGTKEEGESYPSVKRFGGTTLPAFLDQIRQAEVTDLVVPLIGFTNVVSKRYSGRPIRVLLVDADHSYAGVRSDFEHWSPYVAPGGLMIFHDYLMADVARFVDERVRYDERYVLEPGHVVPNVMAVTKRGMADPGNSPTSEPIRTITGRVAEALSV